MSHKISQSTLVLERWFFHLRLQEYTSHTGQFWYGEMVCSGADSISSQWSLLHCRTHFISPPFIYSTHTSGETGVCQFLRQALRMQRWMLNETKLLISFKETRCTDRCKTKHWGGTEPTGHACIHVRVYEKERERSLAGRCKPCVQRTDVTRPPLCSSGKWGRPD